MFPVSDLQNIQTGIRKGKPASFPLFFVPDLGKVEPNQGRCNKLLKIAPAALRVVLLSATDISESCLLWAGKGVFRRVPLIARQIAG